MKPALRILAVLLVLSLPHVVRACASCYGAGATIGSSGGGTISAMNIALYFLLGILMVVLSAITAFFFYLRRHTYLRVLNHSL